MKTDVRTDRYLKQDQIEDIFERLNIELKNIKAEMANVKKFF